jgi:hypothetical protein
MIDAILFVRELSATLGTLKSVLFATFIFQVSVEVIIPIVGSLTMRTGIDTSVSARIEFGLGA